MRLLTLASLLGAGAAGEINTCQPWEVHPQLPIFHIIGNVTGSGSALEVGYINDCSGVVQHLGVYHVFHQCCQNHWEHVVSRDLIHFTRLPSPIVPNKTDPAQWYDSGGSYDGSVTLLSAEDGGPTIVYDVIEGPKPGGGGSLGDDPPTMGVARAANGSDPFLVDWVKDPKNPIDFGAEPGSSFPSSVWKNEALGHWNLLAHTYRYESPNSSFHSWTRKEQMLDHHVADKGGQFFFPLPPSPDGVAAAPADAPTHAVNTNAGQLFIFGTYDERNESWSQSKTLGMSSTDHGPDFNWATAQWAGNRTMNIGWAGGSSQATHDSLSLLRDVRYDPRVEALTATPLAELAHLRNDSIADVTDVAVAAGTTYTLPGTRANPRAASSDVVLAVQLPADGRDLAFAVCALAGPSDAAASPGTAVLLNRTNGVLRATVGACGGLQAAAEPVVVVPVLDDETILDLRIVVDRQIVETFVHHGRAVFTQVTGVPGTVPGTRVDVVAATDVTIKQANVFGMGCGWNDPPYSANPNEDLSPAAP